MSHPELSTRACVLALCLALAGGCGVSSPLPVDHAADAGVDAGPATAKRDAAPEPKDSGVVVVVVDAGAEDKPPPCGAGPGCDPTDLGGETCETLGLGSGRLVCDPATCTFVLSLCTGLPRDASVGRPCGTGPGCNVEDMGGQSCESLGLGSGFLECDPDTCMFDTSLCTTATGGAGLGGLFGGAAPDAGAGTGTAFFGGGTASDGGTGFFGGGTASDGGTGFFGGGGTNTPGGTGFFGGGTNDGGPGFFGGGGGFFGGGGNTPDDDGGV